MASLKRTPPQFGLELRYTIRMKMLNRHELAVQVGLFLDKAIHCRVAVIHLCTQFKAIAPPNGFGPDLQDS